LRNLDMALEKAEITPNHHTVSGLAAAEAVMTRQQKEAGTALIDIGAGTTNLIVFEDGEVQYVAILPIGGQHVTNDLAIGLKTDLDVAEAVKLEHASLRENGHKKTATVKLGTKTHDFEYEDISMIVEARVDELLELVDKELAKIKRSRKLPGGLVITGGTSKMPGLDEFAREKMQLPARIGRLHNIGGLVDTVEDQSFVTVVGLMLLDMLLLPQLPPVSSSRASEGAKALLGNVFGRFKR
jgi:cell division protein FtsA